MKCWGSTEGLMESGDGETKCAGHQWNEQKNAGYNIAG